ISIVYALNRPGASIEDRQRTSFSNNGIDVQLLSSPRLRLIEGDLTMLAFGLAPAEYREMRGKVTCIIHNAWQVDFKISLSSLEPCISGTRNLVDFALSSVHVEPPRFIFVSTAGVFRNLTAPIALEQSIPDAKTSAGLGYGESKWVTEQMLESAGQMTALNPVIVRPGQLSGGVGGAWKTSEWFPTLLRTSQLLGNLPAISGHISWVPIQHAAKILVEMRTSRSSHLHLTHPHPVLFSDVLLPVAEALKLPMVPYSRWVESLESAWSQGSANPGVRLLAFFRANGSGEVTAEGESFFAAPLSNKNALEATSSMLSLASLGAQEANEWVEYLRKLGYLT
ncbi:male sterility protein-domain-containing protein, partial [Mycena vulgaris]